MVLLMAVIGAITRLTESGLSIMEWAPVAGTLPPLSEAEWRRVFEIYKQIPEYTQENAGMTLAEFKTIFWWEWIHRLWGRLIGVVFLLPFVWFLVTKRIERRLVPHLIALFVLGGLQGGLGWYMVASGFADITDVSQYRLVAHLLLAVAIYGYLLWVAFLVLAPGPQAGADPRTAVLRRGLALFAALVVVAIASGGFVAGINAGFTYNTFPLMDGDLVPAGYGDLQPWPLNLFENVGAVQFNHRLLGVVTLVLAAGLWLWSRRLALSGPAARAVGLVFAMAVAQFALGLSALLLVVPVWLGALHQGGALVLFGLGLWAVYRLRPAGAR
jgi:cytochrome c oxidase assembly protein subunit 15